VKQAIILDAEHLEERRRKLLALSACDSQHSEKKMLATGNEVGHNLDYLKS
jgi:hypothetical protein